MLDYKKIVYFTHDVLFDKVMQSLCYHLVSNFIILGRRSIILSITKLCYSVESTQSFSSPTWTQPRSFWIDGSRLQDVKIYSTSATQRYEQVITSRKNKRN